MGSLTKFSVAELGTGAVRIIDLVRATNNQEVIKSPAFVNLEVKEKLFTSAFNKVEGSLYTKNVAASDKRRDDALVSLYGHVKSLLRSPNPEVAQAARRVNDVLKTHDTAYVIAKKKHSEESALVRKLLTHLDSAIADADLDLLDLRPWIDAVKAEQNTFEAIYDKRSTENATEAEIASATNQRAELETAIRGFMKYVDAMATISTDPFWHNLNIQIEERLDEIARNSRPNSRNTQTDNE